MEKRQSNRRGPQRSFGRPSGKSARPARFGGSASRFTPRKQRGERIDFARFINKAIITEEVDHFKPEHMFQDFAVDERLKKAVIAHGYKEPTPIQDRTIPHILKTITG